MDEIFTFSKIITLSRDLTYHIILNTVFLIIDTFFVRRT